MLNICNTLILKATVPILMKFLSIDSLSPLRVFQVIKLLSISKLVKNCSLVNKKMLIMKSNSMVLFFKYTFLYFV